MKELIDNNLFFNYEHLFNQKIDALKTQGNYRYFLNIERSASLFPVFHYTDAEGNRKEATNFCSNDYLGQTTHPEVQAAAKEAIDKAGTGSGGTRNISGTTNYHLALEHATAKLVGKESALIFNSAYLANQTALTTLGRHFEHVHFVSDEENHASMIEGIRGCKYKKHIFKHNDIRHLEEILCQIPKELPKVVAFESVYSMSGTIAPITEICRIAKKYNAFTYCDEVHAVGLYGKNGGGLIAETLNMERSDIPNTFGTEGVDILNGTFAKAFGVIGGFLAGTTTAMDFIRSHAEGFIFTSSLPPATCAAITKSIEVLQKNPSIQATFHQNVKHFRSLLDEKGIAFGGHASHITRINIGDSKRCKQVADRLLKEYNLYLQPINFPTVPRGEECLRIIVTAKHTTEQMEKLALALKAVL